MTGARSHVVIIGKEPQVLQFLEGCLSADFVVSTVSEVSAGVEIVKRLKPVAVVLDAAGSSEEVMMQVVQLKKAGEASVWVMCPKINFELAKSSLLAGAAGYVLKPYKIGDWRKIIHSIKNNGSPEADFLNSGEVTGGSKIVPLQGAGEQKMRRISKEYAVLGGIAAGLGYFSVPFFFLLVLSSQEWDYYLNHGGILRMAANALFLYGFAAIISLPIGAVSIIINIVMLIQKRSISRLDAIAIGMGVLFLLSIILVSVATPGINW